jgi:hypothetical protein
LVDINQFAFNSQVYGELEMLTTTNLKPKLLSSFADISDITNKVIPIRKTHHSICNIPENERIKLIAIRAYLLAEKRNFSPGREDEDWLAAEDSVKHMY